MQDRTRVGLRRIAALATTLPIVLLLFALSISLDRGLLGWFLAVVVPLALFGVGVAVLLRGSDSTREDSGAKTA